jgi:aspartate oxidase
LAEGRPAAARWAHQCHQGELNPNERDTESKRIESYLRTAADPIYPAQLIERLQTLMWTHVGIQRKEETLRDTLGEIYRNPIPPAPSDRTGAIRESVTVASFQWMEKGNSLAPYF